MADPCMYNFFSQSQSSASKPTQHAEAPSMNSSPGRFPCHYCTPEFATSKARAGHQKAHKGERAAARQAAKPTQPAAAPSTNSSPRCFPCRYCARKFATSKARAGHQKAHKGERAAAAEPNFPANDVQGVSSHSPDMYHPRDTAVLVEKWVEPIQPQLPPHQQHQDQDLASSSVPQSFLGVLAADALSTTSDVDDSANMDLTLRLGRA